MRKTQKIKNLIIILILVILFSSLGIFSNYLNSKIYSGILNKGAIISSSNSTIVHFISVGQGDAMAINLPDGKVAVIDTGLVESNVNFTKYLSERVLNVKRNKTIDYLILSHADTDHSGGALRLIKEFNIDNVVLPAINSNSDYYKNLLNKITEKEIDIINVLENNKISGKNYEFNFFLAEGGLNTNDMSHVVKFNSFEKSFLFAGDISESIEKQLVERYDKELNSDVLKVPHHGSKYSSSELFLNTVTPEISVICCGANSYGHPTSEAIENIINSGSLLYRTDADGHIAIINGEYYKMKILTENYKVVNMSFEIQILILFVDLILLIDAIIIFFKREKFKHV